MGKFKIVIEPTRRGLRIRTDSQVGNRFADELAVFIETALAQFADAAQPGRE